MNQAVAKNQAAVAKLAALLPAGLVHPGDPSAKQPAKLFPLPGLSTMGMSREMSQHFAAEAGLPTSDAPKLLAEAIVHAIETEVDGGSTIISNTELAALRKAAADAPSGTRIVGVHCVCDITRSHPVLELTIGNEDQVILNAGPILRALQQVSTDCPHEVIQ